MTDHLDIDSVFNKLKLPLKDIELLTFCTSNKAAKVAGWANSLKTTQTVQTCGLLYQAIPQVNRLKVSYVERKAMLDSLFLVAYPCTQTLSKEFLNQPIVLPEATQKLALVGQSILNSLATGYLMILKDVSEEKKIKGAQTKAASEAVYHGLQCLALMQLRNQQLYSQASRVIWRQANAFLVLAKYFGVENAPVKPNLNTLQPSTPSHCIIRMVALAGAKTNQLTQLEIGNVFSAIEQWARAIDIDGDIPTFWIDSHSDAPPTLSHRQVPPSQPGIITFDFSLLTQQLINILEGESEIIARGHEITIPTEISSPTIMHLENAWGQNAKRASQRRPSEHTAEIIIGFQQCHAKLSGHEDLGDFLGQKSSASKKPEMPDLANLMTALTPSDTSKPLSTSSTSALRVKTKNISRDGYCFVWEGSQPVRIDAGDVIIIREHGKRDWGLGVIRWIRKLKQQTLLGVQLLSSKPQAIAASCNYDEGGYSDFMHAFVLPNTHPQKPPSMLTANILFKDRAKIKVRKAGEKQAEQASLGETLLSTGKATTFALRQQAGENTNNNNHSL